MLDNAFQRRREIERMLLSGKKLTTAKLMSKYGVGKNVLFCTLNRPIISRLF